MDRTNNYKADFSGVKYYTYLINLRQESNIRLTEAERSTSVEKEMNFKWVLKLYAREMKPKYIKREDTDMPDLLKSDREIEDMSIRECERILENLNRLQEKIAITARERPEYELNERGAKDKNE